MRIYYTDGMASPGDHEKRSQRESPGFSLSWIVTGPSRANLSAIGVENRVACEPAEDSCSFRKASGILILALSLMDIGEVGAGCFARPSLSVSLWSFEEDLGDVMDAIEGEVTIIVLVLCWASSGSRKSMA